MPRKSLFFILFLVFCLGIFFQYNRSDGFLRLFKNQNNLILSGSPLSQPIPAETLDKERYLLIYDPINRDSLLLAANAEKTLRTLKKDVLLQQARKPIPVNAPPIRDIIITTGDLNSIIEMPNLRNRVSDGASLYLLTAPLPGSEASLFQEMGIASSSTIRMTSGAKLLSNLLIGGKDFALTGNVFFNNDALQLTLQDLTKKHMVSSDETPLLWEKSFGKGTYVIFNGSNLTGKEARGLLTGMLSLGKETFTYPVVATKTMCIDDFPAPFPEGQHPQIYGDYRLDTPDFFRQIWWPDMLSLAAKYDLKYTGLIIETYNNLQEGPFTPEKNGRAIRNNLILYGRELLKSGGELGVHGYNHQPLITLMNPAYPSYTPWPSSEAMAQSMQELERYVHEAYPDYKLRTYIPPSNMLSPEGREALKKGIPDLAIIASLSVGNSELNTYYQEFSRSSDGILEMPRISSDYLRHQSDDWAILNGITHMGIFSHFIHPDNIFYPENEGISWREMYEGLDSLFKMIHKNFFWLRSCTLSQSGEYFSDYLDLDYRIVNTENGLDIYCWGFRQDACFILRTEKKIRRSTGCDYELIDENVYLLTLHSNQVKIVF